jgi:pyruvate/2-oxoacid:ferredoxin oxidoreductase beta subunit
MPTDKLKQLEKEILKIKNELWELAPMRSGSLSLQYKAPAEKKGPYYQLNYTHKMRSRTQYVRPEWVAEIQRQIEVYKRFKRLIEQ